MAKFLINKESDVADLAILETPVAVGDILVHKPLQFEQVYGLVKKYLNNAEIIPATVGTVVYQLNGHNTSVISSLTPTF